jgi:hypothetical protein
VSAGTTDPHVFAGLVTACRFCGLLEPSVRAHEQARQLDPTFSTSAAHSYWMLGRYDEAIAAVDPDRDFGDAAFIYESMGRIDEALAVFDDRARRLTAAGGTSHSFNFRIFAAFRASIEQRRDETLNLFMDLADFPDPEGMYYMGRSMAHVGEHDMAILGVASAVERGFFCYPFFVRDAWLDPIRGDARFIDALRSAEAQCREAKRAFDEHPGSRVLSVG